MQPSCSPKKPHIEHVNILGAKLPQWEFMGYESPFTFRIALHKSTIPSWAFITESTARNTHDYPVALYNFAKRAAAKPGFIQRFLGFKRIPL